MSEECNDVQESRGAGTRSCASSRPGCWQRGEGSGPLLAPKSARVVCGRRHHRLRRPTDHLMRDGKLEKLLLKRTLAASTVLSNRAWDVPQVCEGERAPSGRRRRNRRCPCRAFEKLLCPGKSASPWFAASWCRDGSLADLGPGKAAFILILLMTCMLPPKLLALRKKDFVPPIVLLLACRSVGIAAS